MKRQCAVLSGAVFAAVLSGCLSAYAQSTYGYPTGSKSIEEEGGILRNVGRYSVVVDCPEPLASDNRVTFAVKTPVKGSVSVLTGRGKESFDFTNQGEHFTWGHVSPEGNIHRRRPYPGGTSHDRLLYWWERDSYTPRGRLEPSFSLPPSLRDWSAYYQAKQNKSLEEQWWKVAVEYADGRLRWYFDDILMQDQPATAELNGRKLRIRLSPGTELKPAELKKLKTSSKGFYTVNIANRYNASGDADLRRGERFIQEGVPFESAPAKEDGENCVDLGVSWFREGNLDTGDAPNRGTFGGRWSGALSANPTRVQFRVPNGSYEALYLLASAEDRPDRVNRLTVQFYRPGSGFPKSFASGEIPTDGKTHLVRIPIDPGALLEMADREVVEMELCGDVHVYRASPDPLHYSMHGGGPPPGVKVYAMTLAEAPIMVDFQPEQFGNVWVADLNPSYKATISNRGSTSRAVAVALRTRSYDGGEETSQEQSFELPPGGKLDTRFDLSLEKYGWHSVELRVGEDVYERSLVVLRRRSYKRRDFDTPGFMFGIWAPGRTHYTPSKYDVFRLAGPLGIESVSHSAWLLDDPEITSLKYGMKNFMVANIGAREKALDVPDLEQKLIDGRIVPSEVNEPVFQYLFAEPGGVGSAGSLPEFYGEPRLERTPAEEERFQEFKRIILNFSATFRKVFPGKKILMPWGNPNFSIPFLQDPDTREAFDGMGFDTAFFDRMPEMQAHQCSLHGMMLQFNHYWNMYRKEPPLVVTVEGPCLGGVKPGALTADQHAAHLPRAILVLAGHGINRFFASITGGPENSSYWGEQHYGGGAFTRVTLNPYPAYASQGTLIRHLREVEFVRGVPTGSHSTYCYEFKNAESGEPLYVLWTIRGRRPVTMKYKQAFDSMDNLVKGPLVIDQMPMYVYGGDGELELGEPDHSDIELLADHIDLGAASDLLVSQNQNADDEYLNSFPRDIRRFPAEMHLGRGDKGLEITLPPQEKDRGTMPFFTILEPETPIVIPGKASYLTLEVEAASDWGRVVYQLRDAKGERWISVGTKDTYSNDDTPNASYFNFDGKRLVRFELPSNLPWDNYREMGSTWWGSYDGDQVVDLPLAIEKVYIERRPKAIYVNKLEPTPTTPVVLGRLYAEYSSPEFKETPPVLAMPEPPVVAEPYNPIRELAANAALPASAIEKVTEPEHYYDGTRGHFHFKEMEGATKYDIYLSLTADGANAIHLGKGLKGSGELVRGFLAHTDFYAFVIYYNAKGEHSHPSAPFKLNMEDNFANK